MMEVLTIQLYKCSLQPPESKNSVIHVSLNRIMCLKHTNHTQDSTKMQEAEAGPQAQQCYQRRETQTERAHLLERAG